LGSNEELFWVWIRRNQPPAMFFCRHDQFPYSNARQVMPIEPDWIIEALGLTRLDPAVPHQGPFPLGNGRLEIRSVRPGPGGDLTKITVVDEARGVVLEQHLYDARGQRLATALTSRHLADPASGAILPRSVEIQWPPAQLTMRLDIASLRINALSPDSQALWVKPEYQGYPNIDLADPTIRFVTPNQAAGPVNSGPNQMQPPTAPPGSSPPYPPAIPPRYLPSGGVPGTTHYPPGSTSRVAPPARFSSGPFVYPR
jgi:hypothetical protein